MKIQSIPTYSNIQNRNNSTKPVSFEGVSSRMLYEYAADVAGKLNVKRETISGIAGIESGKRRDILSILASKYNEMYGRRPNSSEDPKFVINIFNLIQRPSFEHSEVISKFRGSFESLERIFLHVKSKKDLSLISRLQDDVYQMHRIPSNVIEGILESPNKKLYAKNLEEYKSYLLTHISDNHAIQKLDDLVLNGAYNRNKYDGMLYTNRLLSSEYGSEMFKPFRKFIEENYSESGKMIFRSFFHDYSMYKGNLEKVDVNDLLNIYRTTTPKNLQIRTDLLHLIRNAENNSPEFIADEVKTVSNIFSAIDENKDVMKFVKNILQEQNSRITSAQDIGEILENVPIKMANKFIKNILKIVRTTYNRDERIYALQNEVMNSSYMTKSERRRQQNMIEYGYASGESTIVHFGRTFTNWLNKQSYRFVAKSDEPLIGIVSKQFRNAAIETANSGESFVEHANNFVQSQVVEKVEEPLAEVAAETAESVGNSFGWNTTKALPFIPEMPKLNLRQGLENQFKLPGLNVSQHLETTQKPYVWDETKALPFIPQKQAEVVSDSLEYITDNGLKLVNKPKESAKARKLRVIGDVKEIISKKLGAKTLERQEETYSQNATKIRLNLLPEIFDSIKETRKVDREVGKLKSKSSNKDAVELYKRINSHNRRLVRYMLKKRNVDGTRMFEVKDIIEFIDKANARILEKKQANPNFRAKDAKEHFEHLYDSKIREYGKLKRVKKSQ